jgi:hypothetical protein
MANVHIKPEAGSAIFFSYIDPKTNITDNGLTTHSGCPVYEGEKKIITQWVRFGVDSKTPHSSFNTCKLLEAQNVYNVLRIASLTNSLCRTKPSVGILRKEAGE